MEKINIIILILFIVFIAYFLHFNNKNNERFKQLSEKFSNQQGTTITESIKNLGILAKRIQDANGTLDLSSVNLKVNSLEIVNDEDANKNGILWWNKDLDGLEISTSSRNMRILNGGESSIDINQSKIKSYKNFEIDRDIQFKHGSVIKESEGTGIELWPKKKVGNNIRTGEVHFKVNNGISGELNGDSDNNKKIHFKNEQSIQFKPGIQEIKFNLGSIIKEWPNTGIEIWPKQTGGVGSFNIAMRHNNYVRFKEERDPKYIELFQTNSQPMIHRWAHFNNIGWDRKHN